MYAKRLAHPGLIDEVPHPDGGVSFSSAVRTAFARIYGVFVAGMDTAVTVPLTNMVEKTPTRHQ